jgi:hypothetical protein
MILDGMNRPECAFYVGTFFGGTIILRYAIFFFALCIAWRIIDKLALPIIINAIKQFGRKILKHFRRGKE